MQFSYYKLVNSPNFDLLKCSSWLLFEIQCLISTFSEGRLKPLQPKYRWHKLLLGGHWLFSENFSSSFFILFCLIHFVLSKVVLYFWLFLPLLVLLTYCFVDQWQNGPLDTFLTSWWQHILQHMTRYHNRLLFHSSM